MSTDSAISDFLKNRVFVAFDTETTGMWAPVNRIVEIGAIRFSLDSDRVETFQSLVNPERQIPADVIEIHGITDDMVADAPTIGPVLTQFKDFCGPESILVAHNAPFDISFIGHELSRAGLSFGENRVLDTVDIYHRHFPGLPSYSLLSLVSHFNIARTQAHRAVEDAIMVQKLVINAASRLSSIDSPDNLDRLLTTYRIGALKPDAVSLPEQFNDLQKAISDGIRVEIQYNHPAKPSSSRIIQPQQVFKLGSVFYINAFCELARGERTFRLDRILYYRVLD